MKPSGQEDLHHRIQRLLDGEMLQQEADSLDTELRGCRESRELYLQLAALHSALSNQFASSGANDPGRIISIDRLIASRRRRLRNLTILATAAILTLAAIPIWFMVKSGTVPLATLQTTPDTIFQITHQGQAESASETLLREGSRLTLTTGRLEASFSSGVRCILQAPCELTTINRQLVQLTEGTAWFHVPPEAKGFEVRTQHLHIVDLGTEFGVIAGTDGEDQIHVIEGSVEAAPMQKSGKSGDKQLLLAGHARRSTQPGELIETTARGNLFPDRLFPPLFIRNANFDTVDHSAESRDKHGYGKITSWASSGDGIGLSNRGQPFLNQAPHSGTHVAFIQGKGTISQSITGFDPSKRYTVTYFASERGLGGTATRTSVSLDLGSTSFTQPGLIRRTEAFRRIVSGPLEVFGPTANIQISAQKAEGDATLLIDSVGITRAVPNIPDGGFEMAVMPAKTSAQAHTPERVLLETSPWMFSGGAGIIHNGSAFNVFLAPEGSQAAVLQGHGASIETVIHGFEPGVTYRLNLRSAVRDGDSAEVSILLDGKRLRFPNGDLLRPRGQKFRPFTTVDFIATSDQCVLRIEASSSGTTFVDDLHIEFVAEAPENK